MLYCIRMATVGVKGLILLLYLVRVPTTSELRVLCVPKTEFTASIHGIMTV